MSKFHFKVSSVYKAILDDGSDGQKKETFLIESVNHADAYNSVMELLIDSTTSQESIDIPKVERLDKLTHLFLSSSLDAEDSIKDGYIELVGTEDDSVIYSIKVLFFITEANGKIKTTNDTYYVPATSTINAINHVRAYLKDSVFEYRIADTKPTKIDTVLLLKKTYEELIQDYDLLKHKI